MCLGLQYIGMKLFQKCCKKPQLLLVLMMSITFAAAFLLGIAWEHKSALRSVGEQVIAACGFDPKDIKTKIDQKIIEHNESFYESPALNAE